VSDLDAAAEAVIANDRMIEFSNGLPAAAEWVRIYRSIIAIMPLPTDPTPTILERLQAKARRVAYLALPIEQQQLVRELVEPSMFEQA